MIKDIQPQIPLTKDENGNIKSDPELQRLIDEDKGYES